MSEILTHIKTARMASAIAQALAVRRCSPIRDPFLAAWRSVRFSGRFSHTYFVPFGRRLFSAEDFASAHLTRPTACSKSCIAWKRSTVWAACGICSATPSA